MHPRIPNYAAAAGSRVNLRRHPTFAVDRRDVTISGCVVTTGMCFSLRKQADPRAAPGCEAGDGVEIPMMHLVTRIDTTSQNKVQIIIVRVF